MPIQHSHQRDDAEREIGNPQQVRLIDLFAITTLCALIMAMVSPLVRYIRSESRWQVIAMLGIQATIVTVVVLWGAKKRSAVLRVAGCRLGVGYCGEGKWRHWPLVKGLLAMLVMAAVQVLFAVAIMLNPNASLMSPAFLVQQIQLGLLFGIACSRYHWRVFPNSMEFFENGISLHGTSLIPWERLSVRDSTFFPDRMVVVVRTAVGAIDGDTMVVQVTDRLRSNITATYSRVTADVCSRHAPS